MQAVLSGLLLGYRRKVSYPASINTKHVKKTMGICKRCLMAINSTSNTFYNCLLYNIYSNETDRPAVQCIQHIVV